MTVLPLIVCAMVLAVQRLKEMQRGGGVLARYTILYYLATTIIAILHSTILTVFLWRTLMSEVDGQSLQSDAAGQDLIDERSDTQIHEVVVDMVCSHITCPFVKRGC